MSPLEALAEWAVSATQDALVRALAVETESTLWFAPQRAAVIRAELEQRK